jgi:hypothetical protein
VQKCFNLIWSNLSILAFISWATSKCTACVYMLKCSLNFYLVVSKEFQVVLQYLINFKLFCVQGERGMSLHLLVLSSISFFSVLYFSLQRSFKSLVRFLSGVFVFRLLWMGLFSWFLSLCSLLAYRKLLFFACWFCFVIRCWNCLSVLRVF